MIIRVWIEHLREYVSGLSELHKILSQTAKLLQVSVFAEQYLHHVDQIDHILMYFPAVSENNCEHSGRDMRHRQALILVSCFIFIGVDSHYKPRLWHADD